MPFKKKRSRPGHIFLLLWLIGLGITRTALAEPISVAVFYPEIREPYRSVFLNIIKGMEDELKGPINTYALEKDYHIAAIRERLKRKQVQVVITLGSRGLLAARELQSEFKIIVGAVFVAPNSEGFTGISLTPDPEKLFQQLKALVPRVKRVTVIYSRKHSGWRIEQAQESAKIYGIEINALPANNIHQAAVLYRDVLNELKSGIDAIWLPQDRMINEQVFLPLILQRAWDRHLAVFSSNLAHIKRGVLFALYPDNVGMGRSLAELALKVAQSDEKASLGIRPLHNLFSAINFRTAEHLGIKFTSQQVREFELVFPSR